VGGEAYTSYHYRRNLAPAELLPAAGAAAVAAVVVFYIARLLLQRTPLLEPRPNDASPRDRERRA
jgi:hypothetical protein